MSSKNDEFTPEQKELLPRIKSTYLARGKLPPVSEDEKQYMLQVLNKCEQYFASIKEIIDSHKPPFAQYNPALEEELVEFLDKQDQDKLSSVADDIRDRLDEGLSKGETIAGPTYLSEKLKPFTTQYLKRILAPINGNIASLLPYLLASYYINEQKHARTACFNLFHGLEHVNASNYDRLAKDFVTLFSLKDLIKDFTENAHTRESAKIQAIKDKEAYEEYLRKPHKRRSPEKLAYKLTDLQYDAIFQVFSYSLCVLSCMSVPQISERVDYERSYKLFQEHTKAFSTVFWVKAGKTGNISGVSAVYSCSIKNMLSLIEFTKIRKEIEESDYLESLKMCGVSASGISSDVIDRENDPVCWWKNAAIAIVYSLHPCAYPEWWDIEDANRQSICTQVFRRLLTYMECFLFYPTDLHDVLFRPIDENSVWMKPLQYEDDRFWERFFEDEDDGIAP